MRLYYNPLGFNALYSTYTIMNNNNMYMLNILLKDPVDDIKKFKDKKYRRHSEWPLNDFQFICSFESYDDLIAKCPELFI